MKQITTKAPSAAASHIKSKKSLLKNCTSSCDEFEALNWSVN
jgi:hypothetical protein